MEPSGGDRLAQRLERFGVEVAQGSACDEMAVSLAADWSAEALVGP